MSIANLNTGQFIAFHPETGKPLALGRVFFYEPGTTTPKAVYTTRAADVQHPSPLILSATGTARVFMDGEYDIRIEDANGVLVQTLSGVYGALDEGSVAQAIADAAASVTLGFGTQTVTANTTLSTSAAAKLVLVDATGGNVTVTLPAAAGMADKAPIKLLRTDASANTVTIDGNGAETIDGTATVALGVGQGFEIISDGSNWRVADGITPFMRTVNRATTPAAARAALQTSLPGLEWIVTKEASASSSLDFTEFDSAKYDHYEFVLSHCVPSTVGGGMQMQFSSNGGSSYDAGASDYSHALIRLQGIIGGAGSLLDEGDDTDSGIALSVNSGPDGISGIIRLISPERAAKKTSVTFSMSYDDNSGNFFHIQGGGQRNVISAVNAVRFLFAGVGNTILSGSISMYGLRKSA